MTRSETIPTKAGMCVKKVASQKSRVYLLVNKFVSTVNLTIFTMAVSWKNPSASFRLLVS